MTIGARSSLSRFARGRRGPRWLVVAVIALVGLVASAFFAGGKQLGAQTLAPTDCSPDAEAARLAAVTGGGAASAPVLLATPTLAITKVELNDTAPPLPPFVVSGDQLQRRLEFVVGDKAPTTKLLVTLTYVQLLDGSLTLTPSLASDSAEVSHTFKVGEKAQVDLAVRGLTASGEYVGRLDYKVGDEPAFRSKVFRIQRAAVVDMPLEVPSVLRIKGEGQFRVTLQGPSDRSLDVKPSLLEVVRSGTNAPKADPLFATATFAPSTVRLPAGGYGCTVLTLTGLDAGEYTAKLGFEGSPFRQKSSPFSFAVRDSLFIALGIIIFGTLVSWVIKRLASNVRPRLVVRTEVARLLQQVSFLEKQGLAVNQSMALAAIRNRILQVFEDTNAAGTLAATFSTERLGLLTLERQKLLRFGDWVNAARLLEVSGAGLSASDKAPFEKTLAEVEVAMLDNAVLPPAVVPLLLALPNQIRKAVSGPAAKEVSDAQATIKAAKATVTDLNAGPTLQAAQDSIALAARALQRADLAGAKLAYDQASVAYYQANTQQMAADAAIAGPPVPAKVHQEVASVMSGGLPNLNAMRNTFGSLSSTLVTNLADRPKDLPKLGFEIPPFVVPAALSSEVGSQRSLLAETRALDNVIDTVSIAASGLLGVLLVWMPNQGWGTTTDYIAAFVWGMGLFTVGTSTFQGIADVTSKLKGTA